VLVLVLVNVFVNVHEYARIIAKTTRLKDGGFNL